jgi:hypothetical protein
MVLSCQIFSIQYIALNLANSDQLEFLSYLVCFYVTSFLYFIFVTVFTNSIHNYLFRKFQVLLLQKIIKWELLMIEDLETFCFF